MSALFHVMQNVCRHRAFYALVLAYATFFWQVFRDASSVQPDPPATGVELLDPNISVAFTIAGNGLPSSSGTHSVHRRQFSEEELLLRNVAASRSPSSEGLLERALGAAAGIVNETERYQNLAAVYVALGRSHSARGGYLQTLHSLDLAIGAGERAGDRVATARAHLALAHTELRHHRNYAALTRFRDAEAYLAALPLEEAIHLLGGRAWSQLHAGHLAEAEASFRQALALAAAVGQVDDCEPQQDELDLDRATSMAGLSIVVADAPQDGKGDEVGWLIRCTEALLSRPLGSKVAVATAHNALGIALLRHGRINEAAYHHQLAARTVASSPGMTDLPSLSHTTLHRSFTQFLLGHPDSGRQSVDGFIRMAEAEASNGRPADEGEISEWLARFAQTHVAGSALVGAGDFGALLFERAVEIDALLSKDVFGPRQARRLVAAGRFLSGLQPPRLDAAIQVLSQGTTLLNLTESVKPQELAAAHGLLGASYQQLGQAHEAASAFKQALHAAERDIIQRPQAPAAKLGLWVARANAAAAQLQAAGQNMKELQSAIKMFHRADAAALQTGLDANDSRMMRFRTSFANAVRLAHRRGALQSCPSPLSDFLYGPTCAAVTDADR